MTRQYFLSMMLAGIFSAQAQAQTQSPYISRVYDYMPAPGQFVNDLPEYRAGDTKADMIRKAQEAIAHNERGMISLGGYGGYVVFGFDHAVRNEAGKYDFRVLGNAFYADANPNGEASQEGGSSEPGVVMVARDANGNGLPDDPWYELAGSEYRKPETVHNYRITYYRPDENKQRDPDPDYRYINDRTYIRWTTNGHGDGYLFRNTYHSQPYYPQWITDGTLTFEGTKMANNAVDESGKGTYYVQYAFHWGYADNLPNDDPRSCFSIEWAVDGSGNRVHLDEIHFVKVYNGLNQYCGWLGETSTEVMGAEDLHLTGRDAAVPVFADGITLDRSTLAMQPGDTHTLAAAVTPANATNRAITWKSLHPAVATVDAAGRVTANATGTATVQAISVDGYHIATCRVTVTTPPGPGTVAVTGISLNLSTLEMQPGDTRTLTATVRPANATNTSFYWESDNTATATVSDAGTVTARAAGTATVRAVTADGHFTADCRVTVTPPSTTPPGEDDPPGTVAVTGISLDRDALEIRPGERTTLHATVRPSNATNRTVNWTSSSTRVAEVTVNGLLLADKEGTTVITVTTADGRYSARCAVTVTSTPSATPAVEGAAPPSARYTAGALHLRQMEGYACTVYSAGGQARMTFRVQSPDERIPCPLPRGLYLFDGRNANRRVTFKFISR